MSISREEDEGEKAGEAWAMVVADRDELNRFDAFHWKIRADHPGFCFGNWLRLTVPPPLTHAERIAAAVAKYDNANDDERKLRNAAEVMFGAGYNDKPAAWFEGFTIGALSTLWGWEAREAEARFG